MKLFYPVKPIQVNQPFGANFNSYYAQSGLKGHQGIDFGAKHGQPVYASHDGTCYPGIDSHGGNGVTIKHPEGWSTLCWHLIDDDAVVHTGQVVKAGDLIGYADNTGRSTGDHLHFGLSLVGTPSNNGYNGYSDPQPYFNGLYAQDINNPPPPEPKFQFTKTLKMGAWNNEVKELQIILKKEGLYLGVLDGIWGKITQASVLAFQKANNLAVDGIFGPKSRAVANKLYEKSI